MLRIPGVYCYRIDQDHPIYIDEARGGGVFRWKIGMSDNVIKRISDELDETLCCLVKTLLKPYHFRRVMRVVDYVTAEKVLKERLKKLAKEQKKDTLSIDPNGKKEIFELTENEVDNIWLPIPELNSSDEKLPYVPSKFAYLGASLMNIVECLDNGEDMKFISGTKHEAYRNNNKKEGKRVDNILKQQTEEGFTLRDCFGVKFGKNGNKELYMKPRLKECGKYIHKDSKTGEEKEKNYAMEHFKYDLEHGIICICII